MGSPPIRVLAVVTVLALAGATAAAARADEQGAREAAAAYLAAFVRGDAAGVCALYSDVALAKLGGATRCKRYHELGDDADYEVMSMLREALRAAEKSAVKRRGQFVTKRFRVTALAREMEKIDEKLDIRVGNGPRAASGQLATTVVIDRRTSGRRVVLYGESDDGSILRLSSTMLGDPDIQEVARGVAEAERPPSIEVTFEVGGATMLSDGRAWVHATLIYEAFGIVQRAEMLVVLSRAADGYRVDDVFYSSVIEQPEDG